MLWLAGTRAGRAGHCQQAKLDVTHLCSVDSWSKYHFGQGHFHGHFQVDGMYISKQMACTFPSRSQGHSQVDRKDVSK